MEVKVLLVNLFFDGGGTTLFSATLIDCCCVTLGCGRSLGRLDAFLTRMT